MDDVILNKVAVIERCVARVREVHAGAHANLTDDPLKQDSIILNLQRACEAAIDLAMHIVRKRKLGIPQESRDAFVLLGQAGLLPESLAERMTKMVGFRNVVVHDYTRLDLGIVSSIIDQRLSDFADLCRCALTLSD